MPGELEDLRIEVWPLDATRRAWRWKVILGEQVVEQGEASSQQHAHALAHSASLKHREELEKPATGHKKAKKEE